MSTQGFALYIQGPQGKQRVVITNRLTLGSANDNDLSINNGDLAEHQCIFKVQNGILSIHNLSSETPLLLGPQVLEIGKMYIIDEGDSLTIGAITLSIENENHKSEKDEVPEELQGMFDKTEQIKLGPNDLSPKEETPDSNTSISSEDKTDPATSRPMFDQLVNEEDEEEINEVEEEEEEEEEEETVPKNKWWQFFSKSKTDDDTEEDFEEDEYEEKDEEIEQATKNDESSRPMVFSQLVAFLAQIFLAITALSFINNDPLLNKILTLIPSEFGKYIPVTITKLIICYITIDLLSHLILGTNLILFLMGIKQEGTFASKRVKGFFRSILSIITIPTFLTELPIILGKRPLKEVLTGTKLESRSIVLEFIGLFIFAPAIILAPMALPLILEPQAFTNSPVKIKTLKKEKKSKLKNIEKINTSSKTLALSYKNDFNSKQDIILPELIIKRRKKLKLIFLDRIKFQKVTISKVNPPPFLNWLRWAQKGNPLFEFTSPVITQQYERLTKTKKFNLGDKGISELKTLLVHSLGLSHESLIDVIMQQGPFASGLVELQKNLAKIFGGDLKKLKVSIYDQGTHLAIHVRKLKESMRNKDEIYIIGKQTFQRYQLAYTKKDSAYARRFIKSHLAAMGPLTTVPKQENMKFDSFALVDLFDMLHENDKYALTNEDITKIHEFYLTLAKQLFNGDRIEQEAVITSLDQASTYIKSIKTATKKAMIEELYAGLQGIKAAILAKNTEYFR